jgi:hypothetical protein
MFQFEVKCMPYGENTVHTVKIVANDVRADLLKGLLVDGAEVQLGMRVKSVTRLFEWVRMYKFPNGFQVQAEQTYRLLLSRNFNPRWDFTKIAGGDTWVMLPENQVKGAEIAMNFPQQKDEA